MQTAFTANQIVVNPTLTYRDQDSDGVPDDWMAEGDIRFDGIDTVLAEAATRNTHLAQAFEVSESERQLSFTIVNRSLFANAGGPSDAFEVALLDATTGLPVVGVVDLSGSDALLNLQTDGTERLAAGVQAVSNSDGSVTYTINLPAETVGRALLLSFDLLGFGRAQSPITLRDIRIAGDAGLVAHNDTFSLDEDTLLTGNVLANDELAGATISEIQLVSGPAHGTLSLGNDGSFSYQPARDYFGEDSFTYRRASREPARIRSADGRTAAGPI